MPGDAPDREAGRCAPVTLLERFDLILTRVSSFQRQVLKHVLLKRNHRERRLCREGFSYHELLELICQRYPTRS